MASNRWQEIEELFQAAVTLAEEARPELLDARAGDPEVRREVEKLLAAHEQATEFLETPVDSWIGRRLGAYEILKELGQGGMSTVYLARRVDREFQNLVAIKRLKPGLASAAVQRRLRVERQILARLRHPYIARILDGGTTAESGPYIVMELIEGSPIDGDCDRRRLTIRERLVLFRQVCEAVQYAHRNLLVHRDLKPSNILVTPEGEPRLLDFGIAKLLAPEEFPESVEDTLTQMRPMTPRYASPEQVLGLPITTASDVYSLGVLLYELLTGTTPHSLSGKSAAEIESILQHREPPPPSSAVSVAEDGGESAASARRSRPDSLSRLLAGDLDNIVLRALHKEPERRYSSVEQFSEDIRRFLEGLPVLARPSSRAYRLGKFLRRHRAAVAATTTALLLLICFTVVTVLQAGRIARERDVARREQARAEEVTSFLLDAFREADPSRSRGEQVTAREILDRGARRVEQQLAAEPELQASLMHTLGDVYSSLGLYDSARRFLDQAVEIRRRLFGDQHLSVAESQHARGVVLLEQGDYAAAEVDAVQALEYHRRQAPELVPLDLDLLGRIRRVQGRRAEAISSHEEALELRRQAGDRPMPELVRGLTYLALAYRATGDFARSTEIYLEALALFRGSRSDVGSSPDLGGSPGDHPLLAELLHNLAIVLRRQDKLAEAEEYCRQAIAMNQRLYGERHLSIARNLNNLALIRRMQGRFEEAVDIQRQNLELRRELLGEDHPRLAISMNNLAVVLLHELNRPVEAEALYRSAIDLYQRNFGEDHPNLLPFTIGLGQALSAAGKPAEAEKILRQVLARAERLGDQRRVARARSALGDALYRQRRYPEAESMLLASHAYFSAHSNQGEVYKERTLKRLIRLYRELGRDREASELEAEMIYSPEPAP